jgi:hypothetical protein
VDDVPQFIDTLTSKLRISQQAVDVQRVLLNRPMPRGLLHARNLAQGSESSERTGGSKSSGLIGNKAESLSARWVKNNSGIFQKPDSVGLAHVADRIDCTPKIRMLREQPILHIL